jgi:hypothetical protein
LPSLAVTAVTRHPSFDHEGFLMSDFQQRDGAGQLFRNDRAETEKHPSHKGTFLLNGVTYEIAAWVKEGRRGKFFSLKVQEAGNRPAPQAQAPQQGDAYQPRRRTPGEMPMPPGGGPGRKKPLADEDSIPFQKEWR